MIKCKKCGHNCHCDTLRAMCIDGCICVGCEHIAILIEEKTTMIKKLWNKIVSWLFSWQKKDE